MKIFIITLPKLSYYKKYFSNNFYIIFPLSLPSIKVNSFISEVHYYRKTFKKIKSIFIYISEHIQW